MTEPKKRRWFQLHLSTCIVMMFVVGAFSLLNIQSRQIVEPICEGTQWEAYKKRLTCGWPFAYYRFWSAEGFGISGSIDAARRDQYLEHDILAVKDTLTVDEQANRLDLLPLLADLALFVAALLGAGYLLEFLARRREARRAAPNPKDR